MKLFVWASPYSVSYGSTMVFAVAETVEAAREIAMGEAAKGFACGEYPDPAMPANRKGLELGKPTRVVDLPCAEWHLWEE